MKNIKFLSPRKRRLLSAPVPSTMDAAVLTGSWQMLRRRELMIVFALVQLLAGFPEAIAQGTLPLHYLVPFQPDVLPGGRAVAVTINPANWRHVIVATDSGGLFVSFDNGSTWSVKDAAVGGPAIHYLRDVTFAPQSPPGQQVVIATGKDSNGREGGDREAPTEVRVGPVPLSSLRSRPTRPAGSRLNPGRGRSMSGWTTVWQSATITGPVGFRRWQSTSLTIGDRCRRTTRWDHRHRQRPGSPTFHRRRTEFPLELGGIGCSVRTCRCRVACCNPMSYL